MCSAIQVVSSIPNVSNCEGANCSSLAVKNIQLRLGNNTIVVFSVCESCDRYFQKLQSAISLTQKTEVSGSKSGLMAHLQE